MKDKEEKEEAEPDFITEPDAPPQKHANTDRDTLILRQNCTTKAFAFYGDCIRAGLVKNIEDAIEMAVALSHSIEKDITRAG